MMLLIAICSCVFLLAVLWAESRTGASRYTPADQILNRNISDEEFLAAVPSAPREVALRVRDIVSEQLDIPRNCIHPDDRFVEDLRAD